jgi:hypothetical protein
MTIRDALGWNEPYESFNREERNLAAIFFHAVNLPGNLDLLLAATGCPPVEAGFSPAVYYEYAYLRDLWSKLDGNAPKRAVLAAGLELSTQPDFSRLEPGDLNRMFGAVPRPSEVHVQSPGNWSLSRFDPNIEDNDDFVRTCLFKWCFNAKPDLVIQTGADRVVCIEAKLESGEGRYPGSSREKEIFGRRGLRSVGQTEVQRHLFEQLLGYDADFVFLAKKEPTSVGSHRFLSWRDAFSVMDCEGLPPFMHITIESMV